MAPKLFLTGTTGYIGGTVLDTLISKHPEYEISVLLRNVPSRFSSRYPEVNIVKGDYDSADVISDAASKADVVVRYFVTRVSNRRGCELRVLKFTDSGNSDHEPSIKAIIAGLVQRDSNTFLIHLGGTGVVADWQSPDYLGRLNPKIWSDIENIDEITSLPDEALHRNVDKIILDAGVKHSNKLKTAICCPPDIYGPGRGPGRTSSVYCPVFVEEIKKTGSAFYANEGTNTRSWVHIEDLMTIYLKLVEAAVVGGGSANWGKDGYYFASSQEASQADIARATAKILQKHGIIQTSEPKQLSLDQVDAKMSRFGVPHIASYMFAANSRTRADRATAVLGYKPSAPSLWDALEADLLASQ